MTILAILSNDSKSKYDSKVNFYYHILVISLDYTVGTIKALLSSNNISVSYL